MKTKKFSALLGLTAFLALMAQSCSTCGKLSGPVSIEPAVPASEPAAPQHEPKTIHIGDTLANGKVVTHLPKMETAENL